MRSVVDKMERKGTEDIQVNKVIEVVLREIIDDWYERVAPHYITEKQNDGSPEAELKRFHDEKGHRIKFNKDELDFTYGLRSYWESDRYIIEISVNNKVANFNYEDFEKRLAFHYQQTGDQAVPTPYELRNSLYCEIFQLEPNQNEAFRVEKRSSKADIMRLAFQVSDRFIRCLASHPVSGKQLIEDYCVSPFRSLYATVYRRQPR